MEERVSNEAESSYGTGYMNGPWHWKCPSSALYLPTWLKLFPEAKIIFIRRPDLEVAESLFRRRELTSPIKALRFNHVFNSKIDLYLKSYKNVFRVNYHEFNSKIPDLIQFLEMDLSKGNNNVDGFTIKKKRLFSANKSLRSNLWNMVVQIIIRVVNWITPNRI